MRKIWVYLLGVISGVILTFVSLGIIGVVVNANNSGLTFFEEPGEVMNDTSYEVFQTLENGIALARGKDDERSTLYLGLHVLLWNEDGFPYYDEQIINLPEGKCFRQVGIYKYHTQKGIEKTVPAVTIMDE
ncbi:MAG: hypothetical protein J6V54_03045 [Bacteroidales bacterium]|nr:hypothetical protein [Bacteroidales bacterium]